jgi:hypothetical protein
MFGLIEDHKLTSFKLAMPDQDTHDTDEDDDDSTALE